MQNKLLTTSVYVDYSVFLEVIPGNYLTWLKGQGQGSQKSST